MCYRSTPPARSRRDRRPIVGQEMHKDNFARRMKPQREPVVRGGEVVRSAATRGRPAVLYRKPQKRY